MLSSKTDCLFQHCDRALSEDTTSPNNPTRLAQRAHSGLRFSIYAATPSRASGLDQRSA
jgi:hypothetical protein